MICRRTNLENFVINVGQNHLVLLLSILRVKKMKESLDKGLITFLFPLIKMEVKLLEKIAINTSHKTSFQIVVSGNESSFNTMFSPNIELAKDRVYEIALVNLETYYSFPNIDETNNIYSFIPPIMVILG